MKDPFKEYLMKNPYKEYIDHRGVRKFGATILTVTQNYEDLVGRGDKPIPAFREWASRLKQGERLPRGRYFNGPKKKA